MPAARRFSAKDIAQIDATKYLYVRAGDEHRFVPIWVVTCDGRAFARSWNDKPEGWYRAFLAEKRGALRLGAQEVPVVAKRVRGERILDAMEEAYAAKYGTKANRNYVEGFREPWRRACSLELVPR